jgi:hypothetical protein
LVTLILKYSYKTDIKNNTNRLIFLKCLSLFSSFSFRMIVPPHATLQSLIIYCQITDNTFTINSTTTPNKSCTVGNMEKSTVSFFSCYLHLLSQGTSILIQNEYWTTNKGKHTSAELFVWKSPNHEGCSNCCNLFYTIVQTRFLTLVSNFHLYQYDIVSCSFERRKKNCKTVSGTTKATTVKYYSTSQQLTQAHLLANFVHKNAVFLFLNGEHKNAVIINMHVIINN